MARFANSRPRNTNRIAFPSREKVQTWLENDQLFAENIRNMNRLRLAGQMAQDIYVRARTELINRSVYRFCLAHNLPAARLSREITFMVER